MKYSIYIKIEEYDDNNEVTHKDFGGWLIGNYKTLQEAIEEVRQRFPTQKQSKEISKEEN